MKESSRMEKEMDGGLIHEPHNEYIHCAKDDKGRKQILLTYFFIKKIDVMERKSFLYIKFIYYKEELKLFIITKKLM